MTDNRFLRISYSLYILHSDNPEEQALVEETQKYRPFEFVTGLGFTLPAFDAQIQSLSPGASFDFVIPQNDAFGAYDEDKVKHLSKDIFIGEDGRFDDRTIYPGNVVPMVNDQDQQFDGLIKEVTDGEVVVDFNHALSGVDLRFRGTVLDNHIATGEEITRFINQMTGEDEHEQNAVGHNHAEGHHHSHHH